MSIRKQYTSDVKTKVVLELLKEEKTVSQISSEYGIHPTQINKWRRQALEGFPKLFTKDEQAVDKMKEDYEKHIDELYGEIGRITTQLTWLKKKSGIQLDPLRTSRTH